MTVALLFLKVICHSLGIKLRIHHLWVITFYLISNPLLSSLEPRWFSNPWCYWQSSINILQKDSIFFQVFLERRKIFQLNYTQKSWKIITIFIILMILWIEEKLVELLRCVCRRGETLVKNWHYMKNINIMRSQIMKEDSLFKEVYISRIFKKRRQSKICLISSMIR